mgnify:FL=1
MAVTLDMIKDARRAMQGIVRNTPLDPAPHVGRNIYIKAENLQLTGSFKLRGAYNKIRSLTSEEAARGVIACSAGNHAQGIAYSASMLGIRSTICMPAGAPLSKVESTKGYGAEVVLVPGVYDDAAREARRLAQEQGYTFAHPFDDPLVIAGQGTIGLEILEQLPQVEQVIVPIGGGGLISGIAVAIKTLKPSCRIIGVQAAKAASMYLSEIEGAPVELTSVATIADGIAVKKPGELTFALCQRYVDEIITVSEGEIACAILRLIEGQKTVAEGAGAAAVAAALFGKVDTLGRPTVCVVSGGNVDVTTLSRIVTRGLTKSGRIMELRTEISDNPGSLVHLLQIVADTGANVVNIDHARAVQSSDVGMCLVTLALETRDRDHIRQIRDAMFQAGYYLLPQEPHAP